MDAASPGASVSVVYRDIFFPNALFTKSLRLTIGKNQGSADLNLKLDFLGLTREKMDSREKINEVDKYIRYEIGPYRDMVQEDSEEMPFDRDSICPGGTLIMRFYTFAEENDDGKEKTETPVYNSCLMSFVSFA